MIASPVANHATSPLGILLLLVAYLVVGRVLYRRRWPNGLFPPQVDPERERWRRQKRTRVLPHEEE